MFDFSNLDPERKARLTDGILRAMAELHADGIRISEEQSQEIVHRMELEVHAMLEDCPIEALGDVAGGALRRVALEVVHGVVPGAAELERARASMVLLGVAAVRLREFLGTGLHVLPTRATHLEFMAELRPEIDRVLDSGASTERQRLDVAAFVDRAVPRHFPVLAEVH